MAFLSRKWRKKTENSLKYIEFETYIGKWFLLINSSVLWNDKHDKAYETFIYWLIDEILSRNDLKSQP